MFTGHSYNKDAWRAKGGEGGTWFVYYEYKSKHVQSPCAAKKNLEKSRLQYPGLDTLGHCGGVSHFFIEYAMDIKKHPVLGILCRADGAVATRKTVAIYDDGRPVWQFGYRTRLGYRQVTYKGRNWLVHRLICEAFHGMAPSDKPECDHIDRVRDNNCADNLRWVSREENLANAIHPASLFPKFGVRPCEDLNAYYRAKYRADPNKSHRNIKRREEWEKIIADAKINEQGRYILPKRLVHNTNFRKLLKAHMLYKYVWV